MAVAGEHLSFSCSASRQTRRLRNEFSACPRPGRDRSRRAFRKMCRAAKQTHQPANRPLFGKSRTTNLGPFGELIRKSGPFASACPFRFSTKYQDDETDLLYYGFRYLSTSRGGWLNRDPLGENGGLNLYDFVRNTPLNTTDFMGLDDFSLDGPWDMLWFYLGGDHGGNVTISQSVIDAIKSDPNYYAEKKDIRLTLAKLAQCNGSGNVHLHTTNPFFSFGVGAGQMANSGRWQLDLQADAAWSCGPAGQTGRCCCDCKASVTLQVTISKTYTFQK